MIKLCAWTDNSRLSPHFLVPEFRCKCGKAHETKIDLNLIEKLEKLYNRLNCSKIRITSGYRCPEHDLSVGGSSTGQHTKGTAADIICYDVNGNPISSRDVCCAAQDEGFTGIANITLDFIYTHVDVRSEGVWYGDETKGNGTVTDDFYKYFDVKKAEQMNQERTLRKGIDVSVYQDEIDWDKVKKTGNVEFAIIKAGYGKLPTQIDPWFERNYQECKRVGIPVGAYWYSYATTPEEARQEADLFLSTIKGKKFEYPVAYDVEEQRCFGRADEIVQAFAEKLEAAGYYVALYAYKSALENYFSEQLRQRYDVFLSHVNVKQSDYCGDYGVWQYSWKGNVDGIVGDVDLDYSYKDYPTIIRAAGLNGFGAASELAPAPEQDRNSEAIRHIEEALEILKS